MSGESSFDDLMAGLRAGDKGAASEVFNRFVQRLIALARSRLDAHVRQKEDPEDVVQSVFRSFFNRQADGQFEIESWDSLWAMLSLITLRKCGNRIEYFRAARRDVKAELRVDESTESRAAWQAVARDPTPSQAAALAETVEEVMRGLEDWEQEVFSLRLQEYTIPEISDRVGRAERTVRRALDRIKNRVRRMEEER